MFRLFSKKRLSDVEVRLHRHVDGNAVRAEQRAAELEARLRRHVDERVAAAEQRASDFEARAGYLLERIDLLERVLTEHPDVAARGFRDSGEASPLVSVVMPTWNRAHVVSDAIGSIRAQHFADWELIVVDDGSSDDTAEVVGALATADPRIRYLPKVHAGQSAARNHGLRQARGALIAYQDSDNLWYPDFLRAAVRAFAADPKLEVAYGALVSNVHLADRRILFRPFDRETLLRGNYIAMTTLIHRRSLYDELGGFDEALGSHEDWDLVLRYTARSPAVPLPVLASRCRVVDDKRVTANRRYEDDFRLIAAKWEPGR